jgi:hypothetical protein
VNNTHADSIAILGNVTTLANTAQTQSVKPPEPIRDLLILDVEQDYTVTLNLILLTLLMHNEKDCLVCQPHANYRPL